MATKLIIPATRPENGYDPTLLGVRNGILVPADRARQIAALANGILAHRTQTVARWSFQPPDVINSAGPVEVWHTKFRTGPNDCTAKMTMVMSATSNLKGVAASPSCFWTVEEVGVGSTAMPDMYATNRVAFGTAIGPKDLTAVSQTWDLNGGAEYECFMTVQDFCRPISCTIEILPRFTLSTSTDACVALQRFAENGPIYDATVADLFAEVTKIWKQQGTHHASWVVPAATARTRTSATKVNLFDDTTTAWSAITPGLYTVPYLHNSLESTSVPAVFCVYASQAAGSGTVTLERSGAILGTITVNSATPQWWTVNVNLRGDQTSEKYDVLYAGSGAAAISVSACSLYEYSA
jgi:hypothetical protein